jgi:N-acetylneuraminate synthase
MANREVVLGDYKVNSESIPYFIAEIGINHNGDIQIAKKLLDSTFATGWNCAKFQKRTPDIAVPEAQKSIIRETPWGSMKYIDYKKHIEFEKKEYDVIDRYCREKPLAWTASPWDIPSLKFLLNYDIPFIKIPSALNNDDNMLKAAGFSGKSLIVSTGMSTLDEIDTLVERLEKYTAGNYILMHTNSSYPAPDDELNLNVIKTLRERYGCLVGYSGHESDLEPTVIAVSLGACIVERHITLSHDMWGSDQKASLEIQGMKMLKGRCCEMRKMLGDGQKVLLPAELKKRKALRGD